MANAGPNTNGSQFFICTDDLTGKLPKNYTLFGQVTKGLDVVDKIVAAPRDGRDLPDEPVAMTSVTIHEDLTRHCADVIGKVKEFTPSGVPKPLENGPSRGRISVLLSQPAAPASRSWVGRVRVVGAADVIDAFGAWQKCPLRRTPSPGQHRGGSFGSRLVFVRGLSSDTGRRSSSSARRRGRRSVGR